MTLVAAVAVGFGTLPTGWRTNFGQSLASAHPIYYSALYLIHLVGPFWIALTLACGVIRLREPHPPTRRLRDQPGAAAVLAVVAVLPFLGLVNLVKYAADGADRTLPTLTQVAWMPIYLSPAVIAAWAQLRIGRRWRPEPGWIDALGMTLGGGWIALFCLELWLAAARPT